MDEVNEALSDNHGIDEENITWVKDPETGEWVAQVGGRGWCPLIAVALLVGASGFLYGLGYGTYHLLLA